MTNTSAPTIASTRQRHGTLPSAAEIGTAIHQEIARWAALATVPSGDQISAGAKAHPLACRGGSPTRTMVKRRIAVGVSAWRAFAAPPDDWKLLGSEMRIGDTVVDLAWETPTGVLFQEFKTGSVDHADPRLREQVGRLLDAGRTRYGTRFLGVLLVPLLAPRLTRMYAANESASS